MRTGTKFAGIALLWGLFMASLVLVVMLYLTWQNTEYKELWQYVPAIISALIGQGVLNFISNEFRKAAEWKAAKQTEAILGGDQNEVSIDERESSEEKPKRRGIETMFNIKAVRVIIWAVIIIFVVFLLIRAGDYVGLILSGLGGAGALLVGSKVQKEAEKDGELKERTDKLKEQVNKRRSGLLLILCLGLVLCRPAAALYIPDDYETLKEYYIQADNELTEALTTIDEYQKRETVYLNRLSYYQTPRWCLIAGMYVDDGAKLKLGIGKKYEYYLVSTGIVYRESIGVYCEAAIWLQSPF